MIHKKWRILRKNIYNYIWKLDKKYKKSELEWKNLIYHLICSFSIIIVTLLIIIYLNLIRKTLLSILIINNLWFLILGELGDYDPKLHEGNYISEHKLLLKQTEAIEEKAMKLHQTELKGFTPQQAETHFLRLASQLDTYAVDPHPVKVSLK